jgi:hypothetical protein
MIDTASVISAAVGGILRLSPSVCSTVKCVPVWKWYENRALSRTFGPTREEVAGGWRRLHNEELHKLYASPNTIRVIKSREMKRVVHVAGMGEKREHTKFWSESVQVEYHSEGYSELTLMRQRRGDCEVLLLWILHSSLVTFLATFISK